MNKSETYSNKGGGTLLRIATIAKNTFREAIRDRVLYNLVIFVLLITAAAVVLGELTDGQEVRTIVNLGLNAALLFGAFIAIFVGTGLVSKEIEKRTVYSIFSKTVTRGEFIVGKYLGLCLTLLVNVIAMGVGVSLALLYVGGGSTAWSIWGTLLLIYLELTIITGIAILFSSFSTPALSALLAFLIFIIGHFSASLRMLAAELKSPVATAVFEGVYYLFPNLSHFTFVTNAAHGDVPPAAMIGASFLYAVFYNIVILTVTVLVFRSRNFK